MNEGNKIEIPEMRIEYTIWDEKISQYFDYGQYKLNSSDFKIYGAIIGEEIVTDSPLNPYELLKDKIREISELEDNWDGYGAIAVKEKVIENVLNLVITLNGEEIDKCTDIFPNPHGTISIEWENEKNELLSLEIGEYNYSYFVKYNNANPKLINGESLIQDIKNLTSDLQELYS